MISAQLFRHLDVRFYILGKQRFMSFYQRSRNRYSQFTFFPFQFGLHFEMYKGNGFIVCRVSLVLQ